MTEFFAGYVMFKRYPGCCTAWKEERHPECSMTYIPSVRLWAAFCRFIPISELLKVYFWDGTREWEVKYSGLLQAIRQAGYSRFRDFRRRATPTIETRILEECLRSFGRTRFQQIYEGPLVNVLDFAQILF